MKLELNGFSQTHCSLLVGQPSINSPIHSVRHRDFVDQRISSLLLLDDDSVIEKCLAGFCHVSRKEDKVFTILDVLEHFVSLYVCFFNFLIDILFHLCRHQEATATQVTQVTKALTFQNVLW